MPQANLPAAPPNRNEFSIRIPNRHLTNTCTRLAAYSWSSGTTTTAQATIRIFFYAFQLNFTALCIAPTSGQLIVTVMVFFFASPMPHKSRVKKKKTKNHIKCVHKMRHHSIIVSFGVIKCFTRMLQFPFHFNDSAVSHFIQSAFNFFVLFCFCFFLIHLKSLWWERRLDSINW